MNVCINLCCNIYKLYDEFIGKCFFIFMFWIWNDCVYGIMNVFGSCKEYRVRV